MTSDRRHGPNLAEVARLAGVSTATAGRALGNYASVRPKTAERVEHAARQLGYRPNALARGLIHGATHTIGVIVTDIGNSFFAGVVKGISTMAHAAGYDVLLYDTGGDHAAEARAIKVLSERRADGLIAAPASPRSHENFSELATVALPLVLIDRPLIDITADAVMISNVASAQQAVDHLIILGHRHIGVISESDETPTTASKLAYATEPMRPATARLAGYGIALEEQGLQIDNRFHLRLPYGAADAEEEISNFLLAHPDITAIFTTDNVLSVAAFAALQNGPRKCPADVSLVGFDEHEWATLVRPTLTVVRQPRNDIGIEAARLLLRRIDGKTDEPGVHSELPATLVPRESSTAM